MKILIVDDAPIVLKLLETALTLEDHDVTKASNAEEAIRILEKEAFDLGIFDVNMPGKSGIELTSIALGMTNGKNMKVVILTTESSDDLKKKGKEAGAKAWLVKPFQNEDLIQLINILAKR